MSWRPANVIMEMASNLVMNKDAAPLKLALVSQTPSSVESQNKADITARIISGKKVHQAFAVTGLISTAIAAMVDGTVVHDLLGNIDGMQVRIDHPQGIIPVEVELDEDSGGLDFKGVKIYRAARRIMDGHVYVPSSNKELIQRLISCLMRFRVLLLRGS